ncbi:MAG: DNA/RNA non-specific endonuclease [Alphaproteobacteria bacterium]|nr:DNA/RNA non-specific endonuclease [Alphaproteobacteria bacterium]
MGAPPIPYRFDPKIAVAAAARWKSRQRERGRKLTALKEGKLSKVESKDRLAKHVNRLVDSVRQVADACPPDSEARTLLSEISAGRDEAAAPISKDDINDSLLERVIGKTRDFLAIQFFDRGTVASRAVCRIVTNLDNGQAFGTGFLVSPALLLTNHHVLQSEDDAERSTAEFNYQLGAANVVMPIETFKIDPVRFFLTDEGLDFSLVAVAPQSASGKPLASFGYCPLIGAEGKIIVGQPVNIIQHPRGDMKQVVIRENKLVDLPDKKPNSTIDEYAHYEADTDSGSSGSPVFNDQWEVVALHHSGIPRMDAKGRVLAQDGKVWPQNGDPGQIDWIANEGIRASRLVAFIETAPITKGTDLRSEFMQISKGEVHPSEESLRGPMPVSVPQPVPVPVPVPQSLSALPQGSGVISLTVPLTITLSFGAPPAVAAPLVQPAAAAGGAVVAGGGGGAAAPDAMPAGIDDLMESSKPDGNIAARPGFDPNFLGFAAPLPKLTPSVANLAAKLAGGGIELKYFHYSVIMNTARKLAFVSAVNLDVGAKFSVAREGKDHWYFDDRISHDIQAGPEIYAGNPLDFGHLTRRQDAAWGATEAAATSANNDTFHLTNCSPQHEVFNQSSKASHNGVLLWGNLEMYVTAQAKKGSKKLSIFNGPVFRDNDAPYRSIKLPKEFWKLIVYLRDNGKPGVVAFVLSQESLIRNLPAEDFVVGPYKPFQVKVSDLEGRTNLDFGSLEQFDAMHGVGQESLMEDVRMPIVALETLGDIVL